MEVAITRPPPPDQIVSNHGDYLKGNETNTPTRSHEPQADPALIRSREHKKGDYEVQLVRQTTHLTLACTKGTLAQPCEAPVQLDLVPPSQTEPIAPQTINTVTTNEVQPIPHENGWSKISKRLAGPKLSWPNPQLSIGKQCDRLGRQDCWVAVGPAQELFAQISWEISNLLYARIDELEEGESPAGDIIMFNMYMIGKSPTTARPVLLFTCQSQKRRRRAIRFLKESSLLKTHPKIALAEAAMSPLTAATREIRLLAALMIPRDAEPRTRILRRANPHESGAIFGSVLGGLIGILIISFLLCRRRRLSRARLRIKSGAMESCLEGSASLNLPTQSTQVLKVPRKSHLPPDRRSINMTHFPRRRSSTEISMPHLSEKYPLLDIPAEQAATLRSLIACPSTGRRATIGGIIGLNGRHYGLTVGHVFDARYSILHNTNTVSRKCKDEDFEFAFDEEDEEDEEDEDESDHIDDITIALTSQASISSAPSWSTTHDTSSISLKAPKDDSVIERDTSISSRAPFKELANIRSPLCSPIRIAHPFASSVNGGQLGLDWALVEILPPVPQVTYDAKTDCNPVARKSCNPQYCIQNIIEETDIVVLMSESRVIRGQLSPSTAMMQLFLQNPFQEVWTVTLDTAIVEGDSGSWVVDANTGDVYGHVVAGVSGGLLAYIIPAFQVFKDVELLTGYKPELS